MAIARLSVKVGKAGKATPHAAYIAREGQYEKYLEKGERLEATESGNMPDWATHQPQAFWLAADAFERSNGTTYREMEIALPREMTSAQRIALVREWVSQELGDLHAYQWAIHVPKAADGGEQPHVHFMFSERRVDGIKRDPEQYFKRYNSKAPEKGGAKKGYGPQAGQTLSAAERKAELKALRGRWETLTNQHLERGGYVERIDMRSYASQGVDRDAEAKQLPSQWRDPAAKAQIIEFRGARAELAAAEREVTRWMPNLAQVIDLEHERVQRSLPVKAPIVPERKPRRPAGRLPQNPFPVYARNPWKVASVSDIEARSERLFGPLREPTDTDQADQVDEGAYVQWRPEVFAAWNRNHGVQEPSVPASEIPSAPTESATTKRPAWRPSDQAATRTEAPVRPPVTDIPVLEIPSPAATERPIWRPNVQAAKLLDAPTSSPATTRPERIDVGDPPSDSQRIAGLSLEALKAEIAALTPVSVHQAPEVLALSTQIAALREQESACRQEMRDAERQLTQWRDDNPKRAKLHDLGLLKVDVLTRGAAYLETHHHELASVRVQLHELEIRQTLARSRVQQETTRHYKVIGPQLERLETALLERERLLEQAHQKATERSARPAGAVQESTEEASEGVVADTLQPSQERTRRKPRKAFKDDWQRWSQPERDDPERGMD